MTELHPEYGPCDGFGPNWTCSQCVGLIERGDGSIVTLEGKVIKRAPLLDRLRKAWAAFNADVR